MLSSNVGWNLIVVDGVTASMVSRLKVSLPLSAVLISLPLMIWAISNEQTIKSMGVAWDTGAPVWPYETPQILLFAIHFPAFIVAQPVTNYLGLIAPDHYWVVLPAAMLWWWFLGWQVDARRIERPPFSILVIFALILVWAVINIGTIISRWPFFFSRAWSEKAIVMMTLIGPASWSIVLASQIVVWIWRPSKHMHD